VLLEPVGDRGGLGAPGCVERGEVVVADPVDLGAVIEQDGCRADVAAVAGAPEAAGDVPGRRLVDVEVSLDLGDESQGGGFEEVGVGTACPASAPASRRGRSRSAAEAPASLPSTMPSRTR
jgi:hypothetical protein